MGVSSRPGFFVIFRLRLLWPVLALGAVIAVACGAPNVALGLALGGGLFTLNAWFIYEAGRSLLSHRRRRTGGLIAGLGSVGRLAFLGVGLASVSLLGQTALFAAMSGLFLGQVLVHLGNLHLQEVKRECRSTWARS